MVIFDSYVNVYQRVTAITRFLTSENQTLGYVVKTSRDILPVKTSRDILMLKNIKGYHYQT
jgi:hypothetical protein